MKALVYTRYGSADVLQLKTVEKPRPREDEVLVRVHTTTVNRTDNATIKAIPFFARIVTGLFTPRKQIPGTEFSGIVEESGSGVLSLKAGDRVFGFNDTGACSHAEYLVTRPEFVNTVPDNIDLQQAAACMEGAHYALNFINKVNYQPGERVLVNGATGAIGSAAVQLLKNFGLKVTAVCGHDNSERVKSLGADRIIDYTQQDFTQDNEQYHYVFDCVGKSSFFRCLNLLLPGGIYISSDLGYLSQNLMLPLITPLLGPLIGGRRSRFPTPLNIGNTLKLVRKLMAGGTFRPLVDREYSLDRIVDAYRYVEQGHKKGNVVIRIID